MYLTTTVLLIPCLVNCEWGQWVTVECSVVCGGGVRINYREKIVEENLNGNCEGETYMEEACNLQACPGNNQIFIYQNNTLFTHNKATNLFYNVPFYLNI